MSEQEAEWEDERQAGRDVQARIAAAKGSPTDLHKVGDSWEQGPDDPAAREAVYPVLKYGKRRGSNFWLLVVRCPNSHRLARVVRTPSGPVVLGEGPLVWVQTYAEDVDELEGGWSVPQGIQATYRQRGNRQTTVCCFLSQAQDPMPIPGGTVTWQSVCVQCRCRTVDLPISWLREQIDAGRRKVVYNERTGRSVTLPE